MTRFLHVIDQNNELKDKEDRILQLENSNKTLDKVVRKNEELQQKIEKLEKILLNLTTTK